MQSQLTEAQRVERLAPPAHPARVVLDTDAYNEIDDQFAIVHALLSPEAMVVEALYAAPFFNRRSDSPGDGMIKSYDEIVRLLERLERSPTDFAYRGSEGYFTNPDAPYRSPAALDLVERAMAGGDDPLYVVAIGAPTNVASAMMIEPQIIDRIVVIWLGGHALHWPHTTEFNLAGDLIASRFVLDCGVPLVLIPCYGVTSHLRTTLAEIEKYVKGCGAIGEYLARTYKRFTTDHFARSKELWDDVTIGYLIDPAWVPSTLVPSPVIAQREPVDALRDAQTVQKQRLLTWSFDHTRHLIRCAYYAERDPILRDLFVKLERWAENH